MKFLQKNKIFKSVLYVSLAGILLFFGIPFVRDTFGPSNTVEEEPYKMIPVVERDITVTLTGAGTLNPANSYVVTSVVTGDIISAPFEEGDSIQKDGLLYEVDSSSVDTSIETAKINLEEAQKNYARKLENLEDLTVKTEIDGSVIEIAVEIGDTVQPGQVLATQRNSKTMLLTIPFGNQDVDGIELGDSALVILSNTFEELDGTVVEISPVHEVDSKGRSTKNIVIEVDNPGGITPLNSATAIVNTYAGFGEGRFAYKDDATITALISGTVKNINAKEGDWLSKDQIIFDLESTLIKDDIEIAKNNLRRSELSLDTQYETLENYKITSPISGTVIEKNYKAGDQLDGGRTLATIFDLSYLTMTLYIDELDIKNIAVGQTVNITAEAVEDKLFTGIVTKVNINGITSGGTTTYPVTVQIDEIDNLLPGMNVDAEIIIESKNKVRAIPTEALLRGNRVLVKNTSGTSDPNAPEGYTYLEVVTGVSDLNYIEIIEGLNLGDEVAVEKRVAKDSFEFGRPPQEGNPFEGEVNQP